MRVLVIDCLTTLILAIEVLITNVQHKDSQLENYGVIIYMCKNLFYDSISREIVKQDGFPFDPKTMYLQNLPQPLYHSTLYLYLSE